MPSLPPVFDALQRVRGALSPTAELEVAEDLDLLQSTLMTMLPYDKSKGCVVYSSQPFDFEHPEGWDKWVLKTTPEELVCTLYNIMSTAFYEMALGKFKEYTNFYQGIVFLLEHVPDVNVMVKSRSSVRFPLVVFSCIDATGNLTTKMIAKGARFDGYAPALMPLPRMREFASAIGSKRDEYMPITIAIRHIKTLPNEVQAYCGL